MTLFILMVHRSDGNGMPYVWRGTIGDSSLPMVIKAANGSDAIRAAASRITSAAVRKEFEDRVLYFAPLECMLVHA